ncbi:MAG: putative PEP-binding protein, partial [Bacilli bacterium]
TVRIGKRVFGANDVFSLDGSTGSVYEGAVKTVEAELTGYFGRIMKWADERRHLRVRANAETPRDAQAAFRFGAEGIGLARTEHMFFDKNRIFYMRKMILEDTVEGREEALNQLLPFQRDDFYKLFSIMGELNVNVRLLDPPLHEFLPQEEDKIEELAKELHKTPDEIKARIDELHEFNPMMGHRGCRLDISYPEIGRMQTRAI